MAISKKTTLLILSAIAISAISYFTYLYYQIYLSYSTVLTPDEADAVLQTSTLDVPDINPSDYQQDDDNDTGSGVTLGQNRTDAVLLDGIVWMGDSNTGIYNANDGSGDVYDDNAQQITYTDGSVAPINTADVTYGYYDNDNQIFVAY